MLKGLIQKFPYYQPLHLLLAKALQNEEDNHFASAALYNGGLLLHQIINSAENFATDPNHSLERNTIATDETLSGEKIMVQEKIDVPSAADEEVYEEITEVDHVQISPDKIELDEEQIFEEIAEVTVPDTVVAQEEIYEEIAEIDLKAFQADAKAEEPISNKLEIENIASKDFFAFEDSFENEQPSQIQVNSQGTIAPPEEYNQDAEEQVVSKYNDDKLPYTFLWWLAKTRKEHEQIFQPYVTPRKNTENPSELQQQYVEHIFHLQSPFNIADEADRPPRHHPVAHRGDEIIDTFIKNEPQIRAPKPEQINNENKAKKSAEDHNDLVSETLASIYIEQMLYHKAIETYEKLSLKFPEKSRYFADLIQSLEKKI